MDKNTKIPAYIAILLAIILIIAAAFFIINEDSTNGKYNVDLNRDTIKLYKDEGYARVYYDSEFEVYCWEIGEGVSCKTKSELEK